MLAALGHVLRKQFFHTFEHGMYSIEYSGKHLLNTSVLLGSTWGSILELHSPPLLFVGPFKDNIFTCVVLVQLLDLNIIMNF